MWKKAKWIGLPAEEIREKKIYQGDMNGRFAYFRHTFELTTDAAKLTLDVSANSRYRLWINGTAVQSGPCRGDRYRHYYETIDVSEYLRPGKNVLAAQVLLCDRSYVKSQYGCERAPLTSVASVPSAHRLAVEGAVCGLDGTVLWDVTTGEADWKVYLDDSFYLLAEPIISDNLGASIEHLDFAKIPMNWKTADFDDSGWRQGEAIETVRWGDFEQGVGLYLDFHMMERPIPLLLEEEHVLTKELGTPALGDADQITVDAGAKKTMLFVLDVLGNTYPIYRFEGGKGAKVSFTYFEKFVSPREGESVKRDDYENGVIGEGNGLTDTVLLDGGSVTYEPFWYRTFRFLRIEIAAAAEAVTFYRPRYHKTGYPLQAKSHIDSSEPWVKQLYEMCVHTLEGCMMETYMDCPFWEQMQYPMDTRLQAVFTYVCSTDTALARKALEDFHCSKIPEGLVLGKAPTGYLQVISTFSLYYIFMIWDFYLRTGDLSVLKRYRADVDGILEYYDGKIGDSGMVEQLDYWAFVDWQEAWGESQSFGRPEATVHGPSAIINLMYAYALKTGADIMEASGRAALADEYRRRQQQICAMVQAGCWNEARGMYQEGPSFEQYTQHAQSWAVLNGMVTGVQAKEVMRKTFEDADVLRCYFSTCYELFRACELAGCYELTKQQMDWWIDLIGERCTTCPETPKNARSECHAWSAQPMYELFSAMAGIREDVPGRKSFVIRPHMEYLPDLNGEMATEQGMIGFDYRKKDHVWQYTITIPAGCSAYFVKKNQERILLSEGTQIIEEEEDETV